MKLLLSPLLARAGFKHGFGTRRSTLEDYPAEVHTLQQVHGERIVALTAGRGTGGGGQSENRNVLFRNLPEQPLRFDEGDAMVTDIPGLSIGLRTADCLPVLVGDRATGAAAAIHCGWRSLALGLAGKGVRALMDLAGSDPDHFSTAMGPCIGPCCYEVGTLVQRAFAESGFETAGFFVEKSDSLCLDLHEAAKMQLVAAGIPVESIEQVRGCTMCERDLFWSYRGGDEEERMISFITAREPWPR